MFAEGNSVSSLSPSILEYAKSLGINPTGKTASDLQNEITVALQIQDQSDAPGAFRRYVFDYKDPMDYLATGLAATGVGVGAAAAIKSANTARKLKKIADAAKKAGEKLNPISGRKKGGVNVKGKAGFQPRNPLNPGSYNFKPTQSAAYGTGAAFGVGMLDDDSMSTTQIPDEISAELAKLSSSEQAQADKQKQVDAKKSAQEKAQADKNKINETLKALQAKGREFDAAEKERISQERKNNALTLMQEIGSAMVETGQIDRGLAVGATRASERISEERLAKDLAEDELKRKLAEEDKLNPTDKNKIVKEYSTAVEHISNMDYIEGQISELEQLVQSGTATGFEGILGRALGKIEGFAGFGDEIIQDAEKAKQIGKFIQAKLIRELLNESGRTVSDLDRQLINDIVGNVTDFTSGRGAILESLKRVKQTIRASVNTSQNKVKFFKAEYGDALPNMSLFDETQRYQPTEENEVAVTQNDLIS